MADTNTRSSYYEKLVEHLFISDILESAWIKGQIQIEIARAEIDNSDYDLILECNSILRHVQLKCTDINSTTASQKVNIKLAEQPSGCVIWITRNIDKDTSKFNLTYSLFGAEAGGKLPDLSIFKIGKHSKGNSLGEKKERPNIRIVPKGKFKKLSSTQALLNVLFNLNLL